MRSFKLIEVSACDKPAQKHAKALIMKNLTKTEPTAKDTAEATIAYFAEEHARRRGTPLTKAMSEFLDTPWGKEVYGVYAAEQLAVPENLTKAQADGALVHLAEAIQQNGEPNKWVAMTKALDTRLGRELYKRASEAA